MLGQSVGAYTDATHGMTLAAVSLPYYRYIIPYGLNKFKRFAVNVWNVQAESAFVMDGGYKVLSKAEIKATLKESVM